MGLLIIIRKSQALPVHAGRKYDVFLFNTKFIVDADTRL
jgi:hypothetical protein